MAELEFNFDKRLEEVKKLLGFYSVDYDLGEPIPDAAERITLLYTKLLDPSAKNWVINKVNRYKMASLTELAIVKVQPFRLESPIKTRRANAHLAFYASISLMIDMSGTFNEPYQLTANLKELSDTWDKLKKHHLDWLETKDINMFPVLVNGSFLCLMDQIKLHQWQSLAI